MIKEQVNVLSTIDKNYFVQYKVLVSSILENAKSPEKISFLLVEKDLNDKQKKEIKEFIKKYNSKIKFLDKPSEDFSPYKLGGYITEVTYYRLSCLDNLKLKKVLYLDPDIIVLDDISKLFNKNLKGRTVGAIKDYAIGLGKRDYFNAGVLLIDIPKWKKNNYASKCIEFLKENNDKLSWRDQDALNYLLEKDVLFIDLEWNVQKWIWDVNYKSLHISKKEYQKLIKNPKLIHYVGKIKPWHYKYIFPDKKYYLYYNKKAGFEKPYKNTYSIKENLWKLLRWILYKTKTRVAVEKILNKLKIKF